MPAPPFPTFAGRGGVVGVRGSDLPSIAAAAEAWTSPSFPSILASSPPSSSRPSCACGGGGGVTPETVVATRGGSCFFPALAPPPSPLSSVAVAATAAAAAASSSFACLLIAVTAATYLAAARRRRRISALFSTLSASISMSDRRSCILSLKLPTMSLRRRVKAVPEGVSNPSLSFASLARSRPERPVEEVEEEEEEEEEEDFDVLPLIRAVPRTRGLRVSAEEEEEEEEAAFPLLCRSLLFSLEISLLRPLMRLTYSAT